MLKLLFFISALFVIQDHSDLIGKWKLIEIDEEKAEDPVLELTFKSDHTVQMARGESIKNAGWELITGQKSSLIIIDKIIYTVSLSSDTLFLLSEEAEMVLIKSAE